VIAYLVSSIWRAWYLGRYSNTSTRGNKLRNLQVPDTSIEDTCLFFEGDGDLVDVETSSMVAAAATEEEEKSTEGGLSTHDIEKWFNETDIDEDRFLTCNEFAEFATCEEFEYIFLKTSGVNLARFTAYFSGVSTREQDLEALFNETDADGYGFVTCMEAEKFVTCTNFVVQFKKESVTLE